jgi:thioredoxin reductase (NADPH)
MNSYDVVILGTGPAGLQAAIHAARRKASVLVMGKETRSSLFHAHIENFCCIFNVSGEEILKTGRQQAENFGARFLEEDIMRIESGPKQFRLDTEGGSEIACSALIIATGAQRNRLRVPGEKELLGKGVSYCVDCDGNFYKGENVAVVGSRSAAADGALTLTAIAGRVHLVFDKLDIAAPLKEKLDASSIQKHPGVTVGAIQGTEAVTGLELSSGTIIPVSGVFIEQGAKGLMELAANLGIMLDDELRHIQTDKQQATSVAGVFAAGDVTGPPWQMAKAVGEGCVAGINAAKYAKSIQ